MNVHVFQHVPFEGLSAIEPWLQRAGVRLTFTRFFDGETPPPPGQVDGLIVMGGPMSVHDEAAHPWLRTEKAFIAGAIRRGSRVLGICLGAQLVAETLGASVSRNREREIGWFPVARMPGSETRPFGACFQAETEVFHWHGETFSLPPDSVHLLRSAACEQQAFAFGRRVLGLQFHLETMESGVRALIAHAREDLVPGVFVQGEADMLAAPARFVRLHAVLDRVLTTLFTEAIE